MIKMVVWFILSFHIDCPIDWVYVFQWILSILIVLFILLIIAICIYIQYRVVRSRKIRERNFKQDQEVTQKETIRTGKE